MSLDSSKWYLFIVQEGLIFFKVKCVKVRLWLVRILYNKTVVTPKIDKYYSYSTNPPKYLLKPNPFDETLLILLRMLSSHQVYQASDD